MSSDSDSVAENWAIPAAGYLPEDTPDSCTAFFWAMRELGLTREQSDGVVSAVADLGALPTARQRMHLKHAFRADPNWDRGIPRDQGITYASSAMNSASTQSLAMSRWAMP